MAELCYANTIEELNSLATLYYSVNKSLWVGAYSIQKDEPFKWLYGNITHLPLQSELWCKGIYRKHASLNFYLI